jgi:hypothetical protein
LFPPTLLYGCENFAFITWSKTSKGHTC